jgi:hypothetical protein
MALNLYAMLCGSDVSAAPPMAGRYEAEEARLDHVALEREYAGFSGFGYVAAFARTGRAWASSRGAEAGTYESLELRGGGRSATRSCAASNGAEHAPRSRLRRRAAGTPGAPCTRRSSSRQAEH